MEVKISGADERVQVNPCTSPYKWICFLQIESSYIGTGFKIRVPGINRMLIMTSSHCVYNHKTNNYFNSVTVFFPDGTSATAQQQDLYAPEEFKKENPDLATDYGVISLPGDSEGGFGWSAAISDGDINGRLATICGYPGDKPRQTMWTTGGEIEKVTPNEIFYKRDIIGGQPGSPVYTWYKGYWTVIGLLSYESHVNNHGPRFNCTMIYKVLKGSKTIKTYSVKSKIFPQAFLCLDSEGFDSPSDRGGGIVNCQYKPPSDYEKFCIYPVEVSPSLAQQPHPTIYVIRSAYWENRALRLDGTGINGTNHLGSGTVNCQYVSQIGAYGHFIFGRSGIEVISIQNNVEYYIRSVYFTKCYLRMDGRGVTHFQDRGSGTVNCQYYASPSDVLEHGYELFTLKEL